MGARAEGTRQRKLTAWVHPSMSRLLVLSASALMVMGSIVSRGTDTPTLDMPDRAGAPGIAYGCCLTSLPVAEQHQQMDDMAALGARWVRLDLPWSEVQPSGPSTWNWQSFDTTVQGLLSRDLTPLLILNHTPRWARSPACTSDAMCAPADPADFAAWAAAAAARYAPMGVHTWEVWNEQNSRAFWKPEPDPVAYTRLLKATYAAIHAVDPGATILVGGLATPYTGDGNYSSVDFLEAIYDQGARGSFDAVASHPYCYAPGFECPVAYAPWSAWSQQADGPRNLRDVMARNGDGGKKIWATEFGAPTPLGDPEAEAEQARQLTSAYELFRSYPWAGPLFWYSYRDSAPRSANPEASFGLRRFDGSPKPAYAAYRSVSQRR